MSHEAICVDGVWVKVAFKEWLITVLMNTVRGWPKMVEHYQVDTVSRVQAVLQDQAPHNQVMKIRVVQMKRTDFEELEEFPDDPVNNGTRIYQRFPDGRIFEICVLRG